MKKDGFWWQLKGGKGFIGDIVTDLKERKNVLVETPSDFFSSFPDHLAFALDDAWPLQYRRLDLSGADEPLSPEEIVDRFLCPEQSRAMPTLKEVLEHLAPGGFRNHVVWISGMTPRRWDEWSDFFDRYQISCQGDHERKYPRFLVVVDGPLRRGRVRQDSCLSIRRWHNRVARFDMYCYVGHLIEENGCNFAFGNRTAAELRHEIIAELSGTDPRLADYLVDAPPFQCVKDPISLLAAYPGPPSWGKLREADKDEVLWMSGVLDDRDDESCLHSSFLVAQGSSHIIMRRIWRAELRVLMPILENFRCRLQKDYYDELMKADRTKEIEDMEIGDIADALRGRFPYHLWQEIHRKRKIRNELAHFRPAQWEHINAELGLLSLGG